MKLKPWSAVGENYGFTFYCPGCGEPHSINQTWQVSEDRERPTVAPSILVTTGHFSPRFQKTGKCWCTYNKDRPADEQSKYRCNRCHLFITDGKLIYLGDCSHELAGKTIDMPDMPKEWQ